MMAVPATFPVTGRAVLPLAFPTALASVDPRYDADQILAQGSWESEGGSLSADASRSAASPASSSREVENLAEQVALMASVLSRDFINGRVGSRYNTYAHRSRVLRQQKAKLDTMRAGYACGSK